MMVGTLTKAVHVVSGERRRLCRHCCWNLEGLSPLRKGSAVTTYTGTQAQAQAFGLQACDYDPRLLHDTSSLS